MENENVIGVYIKLLNALECPVCLDYLSKPVALCNEGHALCSKCKINITSCPMCRNPISSTRGLFLDQILETLLYPCYKMACGAMLKRSEVESHDLNCIYENAVDKQAVLHNNLLKNIEENFGSFIVHPEVVKETRTVGTLTAKVKTAEALVQTHNSFSTSLQMEKLKSTNSPGGSSCSSDHHKAVATPGISISSLEQSPNTNFKTAGFPFVFRNSSFFQTPLTFSMTSDSLNNTNPSSLHPFSKDSSYESSPGNFQNTNGFLNANAAFGTNSKPFSFTSSIKNSIKKPSTNLSFTMENGISSKKWDPQGASNVLFTRNLDKPFSDLSNLSCDSLDNDCIASNSSFTGLLAPELSVSDSNLGNNTSINNPSTNPPSWSTLVSSNNSQPFIRNDSLIAPTQRKRPTTNLCGLTTPA